MKAICISACQVEGCGIVTPGEEVELSDGLANDERINTHFVIDKTTIKNANAAAPDFEKEAQARKKKFADSLVNESKLLEAIMLITDNGMDLPPELLESGQVTDEERIERIVGYWVDEFGYKFPTDPKDERKLIPFKKTKKGKESPDEAGASEEEKRGEKEPDLFQN